MTNKQFIHKWVHLDVNNMSEMRTKQQGNLSFSDDGKTLFSYGWHPIAYKYSDQIIFTRMGNYSSSTAKHNSDVSMAISHLCNIAILDKHWENGSFGTIRSNSGMSILEFTQLANFYAFEIYKLLSDKKKPVLWSLENNIKNLRQIVDTFGVKQYGAIRDYLNLDLTEYKQRQKVYDDQADARRQKMRDIWDKQETAKRTFSALSLPEKIQLWHDCKTNFTNSFPYNKTYLRIRGKNIETSKGMRINTEHAKDTFTKLVRLWKQGDDSIKAVQLNTTDGATWCVSYNGFEFSSGCHTIVFQEAQQIFI